MTLTTISPMSTEILCPTYMLATHDIGLSMPATSVSNYVKAKDVPLPVVCDIHLTMPMTLMLSM